jgi:PPOX class probable F420-dependent enzyme
MAMKIDPSTEFGARVQRRLDDELIGWLTTVGRDGTPHPKPVWFLWTGEAILVFSRPNTAKLAHVARNPRVALNLDGDRHGGDVIVLTGTAEIDEAIAPADAHPAYVEKYREAIGRIGMTPESFAAAYGVPIRITPEKLWGH